MKLKEKLKLGAAGLVLLAATAGCDVNNYQYFGSPFWNTASWVVDGRYHVSKNGDVVVLRDNETGEMWRREVGESQGRDRYGRMIHEVERSYLNPSNGENYIDVDSFPGGINTMMNGDQGIGDDLERDLIEFRKEAARMGLGY